MPDASRRAVLGTGLGLVALAVVGVDRSAAGAATTPALLRSQYVPALNAVFTAQRGGQAWRLTLTAIQDLPFATAQSQCCFSLFFTPAGGAVLTDGIYTLTRAGVPTHALFLGRVGTRRTVQAVVNQMQ